MGPKRKPQNKRAPAETTSATKKRPNTGTAPTETNEIHGNPAFDVEALTAKITKQVTDSVLASLQDSGLLPRPGTSDAEKDSTKNGDQSSEINAQSHVKGSLTNSADNTVTDLTSSTSSSDKAEKILKSNQHFISSRVPLHATVSLNKKEKNGPGNSLICRPFKTMTLRI